MSFTENQPLDVLQDIRSMMNRSSRFLSLSGWSGIWAGATALAGAWFGLQELRHIRDHKIVSSLTPHTLDARFHFLYIASVVFIVALAGASYFTWRKAKEYKTPLFNHASKQLLYAIALPLVAGAAVVLSLLYHSESLLYTAPVCLVFYGLALINGSKYTLSEIHYLGLAELSLGIINLFVLGYGLIFWALGFGVLHIIYGIIMWQKYDRKKS